MKTARSVHSFLGVLSAVSIASATLFINLEEDLRAVHTFDAGLLGEINSIGGSVRQVFADSKGDRLILYVQAEVAHNISELMVHQAYGQLKGPMGKWNVALGRVPLPWGLLTNWSPDRMPYSSPYGPARMNSADNGALVSGTLGLFDYGLAVTQGFGMGEIHEFPGPGLVTARAGITPGISGDFVLGLSASSGTSYLSEGEEHAAMALPDERTALALDITAYIGQSVWRIEGGGRTSEDRLQGTLFASVEYALFPKVTIMGAGQAYTHGEGHKFGRLWAGVSVPVKSLTIRGGYEYEKALQNTHKVGIQIYSSFSFSR